MPSLVFCCGAECSCVGPGATPGTGGVNHWATVGTVAPVIDSTVQRSGAQCYKFVPATTSTSFLANTLSGAPTVGVTRFAVRFAALPSTSCNLFSFNTAGSWCFLHYIQSANQFGVSNSSAATGAVTGGPTLAVDTWYLIDFSADVHANPWVLKAKVNGGTEFSKSPATTASSFTGYRVGGNVDATTLQPASVNIFVDDIAVSQTGADYPLGAGAVAGLLPAGDGTHVFNLNTDFKYENTTNVATTATDTWTHVDARCSTTIGTFMAVTGASITEYLEWTFQASPSDVSSINGVQVVMSSHSAGTTANKQTLRLNDNGTTNDVCTDLDQSQTTVTYHTKHYTTAPSTGVAWTKTRVDALRARWNSSYGTVDESPVPFVDGIVLEVDYVPTAASPQTISGAGAITSAEVWGTSALTLHVQPSAIGSVEALGAPQLNFGLTVSAISSAAAFGTPAVSQVGPQTVTTAGGIASTETWGTPTIRLQVQPSGVASLAAVGTPRLTVNISPSGIVSLAAFGSARLSETITAPGIASSLVFGTPRLMLSVQPAGIGSSAVFGSPVVGVAGGGAVSAAGAIGSAERWGLPRVVIPESIHSLPGHTHAAPVLTGTADCAPSLHHTLASSQVTSTTAERP